MKCAKSLLLVLVLWLGAGMCSAQDLTVAAAADLQFVMQEVAGRFEKQTGKKPQLIYGSSGNFFQQIQSGAPFDMFFSANVDYPKKLESAGLIVPVSLYQYATGKIVLWVANDSKLDVNSGFRSLLDSSVHKIAIANPQHAPYGQAAVAALKTENLYDQLSPKFVFGENISQAATFVVTGAADAGVVALSLALSPNMKGKGRYFEIRVNEYPPLDQACVILKSSKNLAAAQSFLAFIKTPAIAALFRDYGFSVPASAAGK